jgi:uncharacterized membrane protein YgcG
LSNPAAPNRHGTGARRALLAGLSVCGLLLLVLALPGAAAVAEEPLPLADPVSDLAGVITDAGDMSTIQDALAGIEDRHGVALHVVFVDTFAGDDAFDWTDATFAASGFGPNDFLLAVAMNDRAYGYVVKDEFPLGAAALERVIAAATPYLAENVARASTELAAAMEKELRPGSATAAPASPEEATAAAERVGWVAAGLVALVVAAVKVGHLFRAPASPWNPAQPHRQQTAQQPAALYSDRYSTSYTEHSSSSRSGGGGSRGGSGTF